ncbi:hypothetical protein OTK49_02835 [Vibrio coralliirubri]|uniref:hypothetical protein n=1 Tax=Vibrio coralliirubri TaxID=1516159 RepID=UPI0022837420|nr:hypothetical protein [Vibrio coralliirubri]MCY9861454.1 hypothetical protein [Vibrio coralliirubri]
MLFTNKPQYLAIMNLVGKAFNCNLSKAKRNFSKAAGYNAARDLEMLIPDGNLNFEPTKGLMTNLADHFLLEVIDFNYVKPLKGRWGDSRINVVGFSAPRIVKLILDGSFTVVGTKWANVHVSATSVVDGFNDFHNRTTGIEVVQTAQLQISSKPTDSSIPLVAIEQRVSPELVVDVSELSRELIIKLIHVGSLEQYNAIASDVDLINKHNLAPDLFRRYVYQLDVAHDGYDAQNNAEYYPWAIYLDESEVARLKSLTQLLPPPIEVITFDNLRSLDVFGEGLFYNVIEDILGYSENFHEGFSDLRATHELGNKNYVMTELEAAMVRHVQFITECCCILFLNDDKAYESNLTSIIQTCFDLPLNWSSKPIQDFLEFIPQQTNYGIEFLENPEFEINSLTGDNWSGLPMAAVVAIQVIGYSRAQNQHVFSSMSATTLALEVDLEGLVEGLPAIVTISDILKVGLKD